MPRVLADDLSTLLARPVSFGKLRPTANANQPAWLLWLDVRRLEANTEGEVILQAHWTWQREGQAERPWHQGQFQAQAISRDPEHIAQAHGQVVAELAQAIAQDLLQAQAQPALAHE